MRSPWLQQQQQQLTDAEIAKRWRVDVLLPVPRLGSFFLTKHVLAFISWQNITKHDTCVVV
jgi:hypothetical protein